MQCDAMAPARQEVIDETTFVKRGVVADHVNVSIASQPSSQVMQMSHEQLRVSTRSHRTREEFSRGPVKRSGQVSFDIISRRHDLRLFTFDHPHRSDFGIGVDIDFILKDNGLVRRQVAQKLANLGEFLTISRIFRPQHWPWTTPYHVLLRQPPSDGLTANPNAVSLGQQKDDRGAGPATAEKSKVTRRFVLHPSHDYDHPPHQNV